MDKVCLRMQIVDDKLPRSSRAVSSPRKEGASHSCSSLRLVTHACQFRPALKLGITHKALVAAL
jgi:hypothetical protein